MVRMPLRLLPLSNAETLLLTYILSFITYPSFKFTASNGCSNGDIETLGSISSIGKVGYEADALVISDLIGSEIPLPSLPIMMMPLLLSSLV